MTGTVTTHTRTQPDSNEPSITWDLVRPYLSLRFFRLPGSNETWTQAALQYAVEMLKNVEGLVREFPSAVRNARAVDWAPAPQSIHLLGGEFYDLRDPGDTLPIILSPESLPSPELLTSEHFFVVGAWYRLESVPPWLRGGALAEGGRAAAQIAPTLQDVSHHLVMFSILPPLVGVSCTHRQLHAVASGFVEEGQALGLRLPLQAARIPDEELQNAFVRGPASQLWLNGLHRTVLTRPDRKTLAGADLRQALDPFADQSFSFGAIVSELADLPNTEPSSQRPAARSKRTGTKVGLSRSTGTVWQARQAGIAEFGGVVSQYRTILSRARGANRQSLRDERMGLNYLSEPMSGTVLTEIGQPFEARLDLDEPQDRSEGFAAESVRDSELWNARGRLQLEGAAVRHGVMTINMQALFDEAPVARVCLALGPSENDTVKPEVRVCDPIGYPGEGFYVLDQLISSPFAAPPFSIKFETGHVLSGHHLYRPSYRDVLFRGWRPIRLKGVCDRDFSPQAEKPKGWDQARRDRDNMIKKIADDAKDTSLFARVTATPHELFCPTSGPDSEWYLLCHDQPQEVADFVFFQPSERALTLVHVKGAESEAAHRGISIGAYEVVVAQALKNLRHFDIRLLLERLRPTRKEDREAGVFLVRHTDAKPSLECAPIISALKETTLPIIHKKVVVFQPHVRSREWNRLCTEIEMCSQPSNERKFVPAYMLSSLLLNAQVDCLKQGVDFEVWCEDDGPIVGRNSAPAALLAG